MLKGTPPARGFLEEVYRASPEVERIAHLAQEFFRMIRERHVVVDHGLANTRRCFWIDFCVPELLYSAVIKVQLSSKFSI